MQNFNIALIGCGAAAQRYYAPVLKKSPRIENLYVVDKEIDRSQRFINQIGKGIALNNINNLPNIHGAIIATPHSSHFDIAKNLLSSKIAILCEKPLCERKCEVEQLQEIANRNNVPLCVNNTRRLFHSNKKIKSMIEKGELGKLKYISYVEGNKFGWESETDFYVNPKSTNKGVVLDIGAHAIDLLCWFTNSRMKIVEAIDDSHGGPESVARIKAIASGCEIEILLNRLYDLESNITIVGSNGTIKAQPMNWKSFHFISSIGIVNKFRFKSKEIKFNQFVEPIVNNFLDVINSNSAPIVSGADILNSIEVIEKFYKRREFDNNNIQIVRDNSKCILVTGATGFIGGRIIEKLSLSNEVKFKAAVRNLTSATRIGRYPIEFSKFDLTNEEDMVKVLPSVTDIIHCAKGGNDVSVIGTEKLFRYSQKFNIKKIVYLSTAEVYGDAKNVICEQSPLKYTGNEYNKEKIEAEKVCLKYIEKGLNISILRPSIVYGPYSTNWTVNLGKYLKNGEWALYDGIGDGYCNLIFIDDLVDAIFLCIENANSNGQTFNINGEDAITWNEYFEMFNTNLGLPPLKHIKSVDANIKTTLQLPLRWIGRFVKNNMMGMAKSLANHSEITNMLMRNIENSLKTTPCFDDLKLFNKNMTLSTYKARKILNFKPKYNIHDGLKVSVDWLRFQGIV